MKNLLKATLLFIISILILSGCGMKTYVGLIITDDKKIKVEYTTAMDDELIDALLSTNSSGDSSGDILTSARSYSDETRWEYVESAMFMDDNYNGYKQTRYDKDGYKGAIFSKTLEGNIDDYVGDGENIDFSALSEDDKMFTKKGNTYLFKIDLMASGDSYAEARSYKEQGIDMDYKFIITLPYPALKNNATEVSKDKLTYSWDLLEASDIDLEFSFDNKKDFAPIITWAIIIIAFIVIIGIPIFIKIKNNKENNNEENINNNIIQ